MQQKRSTSRAAPAGSSRSWRPHPSATPASNEKRSIYYEMLQMESGSDLSSRAVSSQVLSALKGLTSVFGMGTGGTPSSLPPEMVSYVGSAHGLFRQSGLSPSSAAARLLVCSHYNGFSLSCQPLLCVSYTLTTAQDLIHRLTVFQLVSLLGLCVKSSPRPISITKLHVLPHFHR